jgi:hypothetical protein
VTAARRISLPLLIDLLSITGNQVAEFWQTVDLGAFREAVSWAGPGPAPAWLDAARDFSEYWTHHQQICEATGRAGLVSPDYLRPVLDTFMRALPYTLRHVTAAEGTALQMTVTGPGGGNGPGPQEAAAPTAPAARHPGRTRRRHGLATVHPQYHSRAGGRTRPHRRRRAPGDSTGAA